MKRSKLKTYETSKLFYSKYLYCLTAVNSLASIFRNKNFKLASKELDALEYQYKSEGSLIYKRGMRDISLSASHFFDAKLIYNELTRYQDSYIIRIENNTINFYCNNLDFLKQLSNKLENVRGLYKPDPKLINFLRSNTDTIVVDKDIDYQYKIVFNSNHVNPQLADWLENNKDKVKSTEMLRQDIRSAPYIAGRYVWCKSENVVMLLKIVAGNSIQKVYKLISKQDIDK